MVKVQIGISDIVAINKKNNILLLDIYVGFSVNYDKNNLKNIGHVIQFLNEWTDKKYSLI